MSFLRLSWLRILSGALGWGIAPVIAAALPAQTPNDASSQASAAVEREVRQADEAFWSAFNRCDAAAMASRFAGDAEFYHDKTGLTTTRAGVTASMTAGPCGDQAKKRLRREPISGASRYDMLAGGYALLSGQHRFYVAMDGRPKQHDSIARYIELWQKSPAGWQMRRIVSYDHQPDLPNLKAVPVSASILAGYLGTYRASDGSVMLVKKGDKGLELVAGPSSFTLVPLGGGSFGTLGRWLIFRFDKDQLEVVEEGRVVAIGCKSVR